MGTVNPNDEKDDQHAAIGPAVTAPEVEGQEAQDEDESLQPAENAGSDNGPEGGDEGEPQGEPETGGEA